MKKCLALIFSSFFVFMLVLTGCSDSTDDPDIPLASLVNTVWVGETPRTGDWLTITFKADSKVILSFAADNTTNEWAFTYDSTGKSGTITVSSGWNPAPDGFTISQDAKTLTITHYGNHEGGARSFKRVRQADLNLDANPFSPGTLSDDLIGSVWGGETPRSGDWLTIAFKADSKVILSFAADNTTNEWAFTYDSTGKSGTITVSSGWNPAPDGFTISQDAKTLTITHYGNHDGGAREFKRFH